MFYSIWKQTLHLQTFGKKKKWKSSFKILLENSGSFLLEALSLGLLARLLESQVPSVWVDFNSSKDALAVRPLHSLCQGCSAPLVNFLFGINNKAMRYQQSSLKWYFSPLKKQEEKSDWKRCSLNSKLRPEDCHFRKWREELSITTAAQMVFSTAGSLDQVTTAQWKEWILVVPHQQRSKSLN